MSNYFELLQKALVVHEKSQQSSVRGPRIAKQITDEVEAFADYFKKLNEIKAQTHRIDEELAYALLEVLRGLEAQRRVLQSVLESAQREDDFVVQGVIASLNSVRRVTYAQKLSDRKFLSDVEDIFDLIRDDMGIFYSDKTDSIF